MEANDIIKWVFLFLLTIAWITTYSADVMPPNLDIITGSIIGLMYGIPVLGKIGKALSKD